MPVMYVLHISAGALGLVAGFVAISVAKGGRLHRQSGMVFAYAMLMMAVMGFSMTLIRNVSLAANVPAALLTAYLVITGVTAVRPIAAVTTRVAFCLMLVALGIGLTDLIFGLQAIANGGKRLGIPAFPFFMFAVAALLAVAGDVRIIRVGALRGAQRMARHLWRMCFALFIAALSFFLGQAKVIPKPIRIYPMLAVPVVAVLLVMLYWLWRVRFRRSLRGLIGVGETRGAAA